MTAAKRRISAALRRLTLTEQQAQLVRLLLREEKRERERSRESRRCSVPSGPKSYAGMRRWSGSKRPRPERRSPPAETLRSR